MTKVNITDYVIEHMAEIIEDCATEEELKIQKKYADKAGMPLECYLLAIASFKKYGEEKGNIPDDNSIARLLDNPDFCENLRGLGKSIEKRKEELEKRSEEEKNQNDKAVFNCVYDLLPEAMTRSMSEDELKIQKEYADKAGMSLDDYLRATYLVIVETLRGDIDLNKYGVQPLDNPEYREHLKELAKETHKFENSNN